MPLSNCPLCGRPLENYINEHHLVPKAKKGKDTVTLHEICHMKIHSLLSEKELAKDYYTVDLLLQHPDIQTFIKWVQKKPNNFKDSSIMSNNHKWKRRK
jgi:hypothetical protein